MEVGTIVVALLPKVGAVANLEPREAERVNGYAPTYGPVFSTSTAILAGDRLAAIDQAIVAANGKIRQIVGAAAQAAGRANRLQFLDPYALFDRLDFKNSLDSTRRVTLDPNTVLDNQYVAGRFHLLPLNMAGWRLSAGGLQSADGMHPSGCGYGMLALEALKLLGPAAVPGGLLARAFLEDALLSRYPIELRAVISLLQMTRDLSRTNAFFHSGQTFLTANSHAADILRAMHSVFLP